MFVVRMTPPQHSCTDFNENVTGAEDYISVFCYLNILSMCIVLLCDLKGTRIFFNFSNCCH